MESWTGIDAPHIRSLNSCCIDTDLDILAILVILVFSFTAPAEIYLRKLPSRIRTHAIHDAINFHRFAKVDLLILTLSILMYSQNIEIQFHLVCVLDLYTMNYLNFRGN